jgi:hypothetical protein
MERVLSGAGLAYWKALFWPLCLHLLEQGVRDWLVHSLWVIDSLLLKMTMPLLLPELVIVSFLVRLH